MQMRNGVVAVLMVLSSMTAAAQEWIDRPTQSPDLATPTVRMQAREADATDITISGKVVDSGGNPAYAFVLAYRSDNKQVAAGAYTTFSGVDAGKYTMTVPPGTYDFYVRYFGLLPIEVHDVSVQGNITENFTIPGTGSTTVPAYLTASATSTPAVFIGSAASTTTLTLTSTQSLGTSVTLFNEFGNFTVDGTALGTFELYDDGTHGDRTAGDHVYTRTGIALAGNASLLRCGSVATGNLLYARTSSNTIIHVPAITVIGVNPAFTTTSTTTDNSQFSADGVNVIGDTSKSDWAKPALLELYKNFADVYDYVFLFPDVLQPNFAGLTLVVRNDVAGIGLPISDTSSQYGSAGKLQAYAMINFNTDPPLLHEFMHRWANYITPPFDTAYAGHWGYSGADGELGGFDPATLVHNSDGSYTVANVAPQGYQSDFGRYAAIERYLAGFAPAAAVGSIPVFTNVQLIGGNSNHFTGTRTDVTMSTIVAKYGARNPAADRAQKQFRVAFVGVTRQPLGAAGMAYLHVLAQQFAGNSPCASSYSLAAASNNVASVSVGIYPKTPPRRRVVRR